MVAFKLGMTGVSLATGSIMGSWAPSALGVGDGTFMGDGEKGRQRRQRVRGKIGSM